MDREALILKAVGRLVDLAHQDVCAEIVRIKREASAAGRLNSGSSVAAIGNACASGFQEACVSALEKVQLEDREGALELASIVRTKTLAPARNRFVETYVENTVGPPPKNLMVDTNSILRSKARAEMGQRLQRIEGDVVEEFQLAITRRIPEERDQVHTSTFVYGERLEQLKAKTSINWDFTRLIALCEELNIAWQYGAHHAVAMLTRALLDHVPPIFDQSSFAGVAANYSGGRSFKDTMDALDKVSRKIADGHLHTRIRNRESLPNPNQVDFRAGVDVLLAEIVRIVP